MRFGNRKYWLFQAFGWGSFILLHIFFNWSLGKLASATERESFFGRLGIFIALGLLITHLMRYMIIQANLLQKRLDRQIISFFLVTLAFSCLAGFGELLLRNKLGLLSKNDLALIEQDKNIVLTVGYAFNAFIYYFIWSAIYFMYHYIAKSRKQQLDTLRLESLVKELELQTIKAHINPHFIFNSLNSIRALVDENPGRARNAVTELSNILRSSMQSDKMETVTLEKELSIVKDYLALENMRFEDRLKVEYEVDEDTLDQPVPPMMLQTLVENAIKHGISKQMRGGVVRVISDFRDNYHELVVQNTGYLNGYQNSEGFGLSSTTNRLSLLYGDRARFEIRQKTPSTVEARVMIPVNAS
jgi:sensor histidine kinase YesM